MKKRFFLVTLALCLLVSLAGCGNSKEDTPQTEETIYKESVQFSDPAEKIAEFKKHVQCPTEVLDVEFYFDFPNGIDSEKFNQICAIKVKPTDVAAWGNDYSKTDKANVELGWWDDLALYSDNWKRTSTPSFYKHNNSNTYLAVYKSEGIILKYSTPE